MVRTRTSSCGECKTPLTIEPFNSRVDVLLCMNVSCKKFRQPQGTVPIGLAEDEPVYKKARIFHANKSPNQIDDYGRPLCDSCMRPFLRGLTKSGEPNNKEKLCWKCSGLSEEYRQNRQVYGKDGKPIFTVWAKGKTYGM